MFEYATDKISVYIALYDFAHDGEEINLNSLVFGLGNRKLWDL